MSTIKRITYLERRDDLTPAQFSEHWRTTHAEIARDLPAVTSYRQNHVADVVARPTDGEPYAVDGIVELWFGDGDGFDAGYESDVATRLTADEPNFLQGMIGGAVHSGEATPSLPAKVWVLARGDEAEARSTAEEIAAAGHGQFVQWNRTDKTRPPLSRETLRVDPDPPEVAIAIGFTTAEQAASQAPVIARLATASALRRLQVVTAREVTVI